MHCGLRCRVGAALCAFAAGMLAGAAVRRGSIRQCPVRHMTADWSLRGGGWSTHCVAAAGRSLAARCGTDGAASAANPCRSADEDPHGSDWPSKTYCVIDRGGEVAETGLGRPRRRRAACADRCTRCVVLSRCEWPRSGHSQDEQHRCIAACAVFCVRCFRPGAWTGGVRRQIRCAAALTG